MPKALRFLFSVLLVWRDSCSPAWDQKIISDKKKKRGKKKKMGARGAGESAPLNLLRLLQLLLQHGIPHIKRPVLAEVPAQKTK